MDIDVSVCPVVPPQEQLKLKLRNILGWCTSSIEKKSENLSIKCSEVLKVFHQCEVWKRQTVWPSFASACRSDDEI